MNFKLRAEMLGKTEEEIRSEMASALGRIGSMFGALLNQLSQLESKLNDAGDESLRVKYSEVLKEARMYYWYLIVQREALGLRNHEAVIKEYAVPPSVLQRR